LYKKNNEQRINHTKLLYDSLEGA